MWESLLLQFQHGPESSFNDRNRKTSYTRQIIIPRVPPNDMKEYKPYNTQALRKICRQHVNHIVMLLYGTRGIAHFILKSVPGRQNPFGRKVIGSVELPGTNQIGVGDMPAVICGNVRAEQGHWEGSRSSMWGFKFCPNRTWNGYFSRLKLTSSKPYCFGSHLHNGIINVYLRKPEIE